MKELARFGVSIDRELLDRFDQYCRDREYPTRSKAIEDLLRAALKTEAIQQDGAGQGVVVMLYDHHRRDLTNRLTEIQHQFQNLVICTQHIHLDHDFCMETIAVHGSANEMQAFTQQLEVQKGVEFCSLTIARNH